MTAKAAELAKQATRAAEFRGHRLSSWEWDTRPNGRVIGHAQCPDCSYSAHVDTDPDPNGIDISGTAVSLNCVL